MLKTYPLLAYIRHQVRFRALSPKGFHMHNALGCRAMSTRQNAPTRHPEGSQGTMGRALFGELPVEIHCMIIDDLWRAYQEAHPGTSLPRCIYDPLAD